MDEDGEVVEEEGGKREGGGIEGGKPHTAS